MTSYLKFIETLLLVSAIVIHLSSCDKESGNYLQQTNHTDTIKIDSSKLLLYNTQDWKFDTSAKCLYTEINLPTGFDIFSIKSVYEESYLDNKWIKIDTSTTNRIYYTIQNYRIVIFSHYRYHDPSIPINVDHSFLLIDNVIFKRVKIILF